MKKSLVAVILLLWILPARPASTPTVTSATVSDGVLTVGGSDFGSGASVYSALADNIENGTAGTAFSSTNWIQYDAADRPVRYSNNDSHSGSKCLSGIIETLPAGNEESAIVWEAPSSFTTIYYTTWIKLVKWSTDDMTDFQWKNWRVTNNPATGHYQVNLDGVSGVIFSHYPTLPLNGTWTQNRTNQVYTGTDGDNCSMAILADGYPYGNETTAQWFRIQAILTRNSVNGAADGYIEFGRIGYTATNSASGRNVIRRNPSAPYEYGPFTDVVTHNAAPTNPGGNWQYILIGLGYVNPTGGTTRKWEHRYDDVYVANSQARVEIGNASTWAACTQLELQAPYSSWTAGSIEATYRAGTLTGTKYAYVVDSTGAVNANGVEVTEGPPPADVTNPTIVLVSPASSPHDNGSVGTASASGTAADNVAVASVTWTNDRGGSGTAAGTTSWTISSISLYSGSNTITATVHDTSGNTASTSWIETYTPAVTPGATGSRLRLRSP